MSVSFSSNKEKIVVKKLIFDDENEQENKQRDKDNASDHTLEDNNDSMNSNDSNSCKDSKNTQSNVSESSNHNQQKDNDNTSSNSNDSNSNTSSDDTSTTYNNNYNDNNDTHNNNDIEDSNNQNNNAESNNNNDFKNTSNTSNQNNSNTKEENLKDSDNSINEDTESANKRNSYDDTRNTSSDYDKSNDDSEKSSNSDSNSSNDNDAESKNNDNIDNNAEDAESDSKSEYDSYSDTQEDSSTTDEEEYEEEDDYDEDEEYIDDLEEYEDEEYSYYDDYDESIVQLKYNYNVIQAFLFEEHSNNKFMLSRDVAKLYELIFKIFGEVDDKSRIDYARFDSYNVKKLLLRKYQRKPLHHYRTGYEKQLIVLIIDNSGSMTWLADIVTQIVFYGLKNNDIEVYVAPNGYIEKMIISKNNRIVFKYVQHDEIMRKLVNRNILYIGDFDGGDTPVILSRNNFVVWIAPEERYRRFLSHDWMHYSENDFKGVFIRSYDLNEMIKGLKRVKRRRQFIDLHKNDQFYEDYDDE